jgi:two-component system, OmpR family, sensor histidine kinase KdpD
VTRQLPRLAVAVGSIAAITFVYAHALPTTNGAIVALTFLLVVLLVAATSALWTAVATSLAAMVAFNFFFLPPVGTLSIADPQNWVALFTFLAVSLVASNLSSRVRAREREAVEGRDEMARLFDLSRDVLHMTDSRDAISGLSGVIARRFGLEYVAVCLPKGAEWDVFEAGSRRLALDRRKLSEAFADAERALAPHADVRRFAGHRTFEAQASPGSPGSRGSPGSTVRLVPLRIGARPVGLIAAAGRPVEPGTLDALGGVVAIAIERGQLLEARTEAELSRRSEELKSALLASLGHDLRTPLTAIRVAASNLQASWLTPDERLEQNRIVLDEVDRLTRLFQNILDMARIEAGEVSADARWVHPSEIVGAARDLVPQALRNHPVDVQILSDVMVKVDPRLTAAALSHLLENAAQYSPAGAPIEVTARVGDGEMTVSISDGGPGILEADLPRVFERFYRGGHGKKHAGGTGMGLSIARGLIAAERGRIWAENRPGGGAQFTIAIAAESRSATTELAES